MSDSNWGTQSVHVLNELKRLDRTSERICDEIKHLSEATQAQLLQIHKDVVALKTRSSMWGAVAGSVFGALISALLALFSHK